MIRQVPIITMLLYLKRGPRFSRSTGMINSISWRFHIAMNDRVKRVSIIVFGTSESRFLKPRKRITTTLYTRRVRAYKH